jgi:hypothetical protein
MDLDEDLISLHAEEHTRLEATLGQPLEQLCMRQTIVFALFLQL